MHVHITPRPTHSEARRLMAIERAHIEAQRAEFIAEVCRSYRSAGAEVRIETPVNSVNKHLFVRKGDTWHAVGYFDSHRDGIVFCVLPRPRRATEE